MPGGNSRQLGQVDSLKGRSVRLQQAVKRDVSDADQATDAVVVHLIDGTYELFRHFYGQRRFNQGNDRPFAAVVGVLQTVLRRLATS